MTTLDAAPAASFVTEDNIQVKGYRVQANYPVGYIYNGVRVA